MANTTYKTTPRNGQHFSTSGTTARNTTAISADSVTVHASQDVYFKVGGSSIEASSSSYDMHLAAGAYVEITMNGATHIAAIQVSTAGVFYINEEK